MTIVDHVDLDELKHFLGDVCGKGHRYRGKELSLRLKSNNQCCACKLEYRQKRDKQIHPERVARKESFAEKQDKHVSAERFQFNPQHHQLGNLCKERHNYNHTGKTIRKKTKNGLGGGCLACEWEQYNVKAQMRIIEQHKSQAYVKDCKCEKCQSELKRRAAQRLITQQETTKLWFERNKDYAKNWRRTEAGLNCRRRKDQVRHARKRKPGSTRYTAKDWNNRKLLFDNCCVYCGIKNGTTLEHVIPLSDDRGFDRLENVVPACWNCNCKLKREKRMAEWYPQQPFFSSERFDKLMSVLGEKEINAVLEDLDQIDS